MPRRLLRSTLWLVSSLCLPSACDRAPKRDESMPPIPLTTLDEPPPGDAPLPRPERAEEPRLTGDPLTDNRPPPSPTVSAQRNPAAPSNYSQGLLAAFNANLFVELLWQHSPGTADPKFLLDLIIEPDVDTPVGNMEVKLIRDMNVLYTPITSTATEVLPNGGAGAWT